ncbi:hypothetical protein OE88DRAFT_745678 [Heliocybe sulcata]|uniref:F-box domain-containing protein n=1 Tax=Heliocybe sulcata TaxID=5364 RepID=A0A5C3MR75_9AGAM|nr:hypothetical protein OE88DRAFT_745678 [Heliocybe sulcata]
MPSLAQLPDDILIEIFLASALPLPLPIPPDTSIWSLPASRIQPLCIAALRLDANWSKPEPTMHRFTPVLAGIQRTNIDELRWLPGAQWLVTAQRNRPRGRQSTTFAFWAVPHEGEPYRAAAFEGHGYFRNFAVTLDEGNGERHAVLALTVTITGEELLQVYRIALSSLPELDTVYIEPKAATVTPPVHYSSGKVILVYHINRPSTSHGVFYQVLSFRDIVVATLVKLFDPPGQTDHVLLLNIRTGVRRLLHIRFKETLERVHVALYPTQLVVLGALEDALLVRSYAIPSELLSSPSPAHSISPSPFPPPSHLQQADPQPTDFDPPILDAIVSKLPGALDFTLSSNPPPYSTPSPRLTFTTFRFGEGALTRLYHASLPLPPSPAPSSPRKFAVFPTALHLPPSFSGGTQIADLPRLGPAGRRGVWLQRDVETEEVRLVGVSLPNAGGSKSFGTRTLLSAYPNLPFRPNAVRALAFDEALGRMGVGLFNGEVYVLEY